MTNDSRQSPSTRLLIVDLRCPLRLSEGNRDSDELYTNQNYGDNYQHVRTRFEGLKDRQRDKRQNKRQERTPLQNQRDSQMTDLDKSSHTHQICGLDDRNTHSQRINSQLPTIPLQFH